MIIRASIISVVIAVSSAQQEAASTLLDFAPGNNNNLFAPEATFEKCRPCDGTIDESKMIDGLSCGEWFEYASQVPAYTDECALERLLGWKFCGCPSNTHSPTCTFCEAAETAIDMDKQLPFSTIPCKTFVDVPALDGEHTCQIAQDFSSYCGCPTATPRCSLCADGAPPTNLEAPLYLGMTCADIHDLYSVSSARRCGELEADYPFDLQAYCGCNNAPKPQHGCSFCPYQGELHNYTQTLVSDPTSQCGDWETLAEYAKEGESTCAVFQYVGLECCDDMVLPDFFKDFLGDEETDEESVALLEGRQPDEATEEPTEEIFQLDYNDPDAGFDPNDLAIPFVAAVPNSDPPQNISAAVHDCFLSNTVEGVVADDTKPPSLLHLQQVERNDSLVEQEAVKELGDLFHHQVNSQLQGSDNITSSVEVPAQQGRSSSLAATKWKMLLNDLQGIDIPPEMTSLQISDEFANRTFLPTLSQCLMNAVDTFSDCALCAGGERPTQPEKMIPIVGLFCDEYDAWRADATPQDCKSMKSWLPFDMGAWCGCPGIPDPTVLDDPPRKSELENITTSSAGSQEEHCSFCPEGMIMVLGSWQRTINDPSLLDGYEESSTCAQWAEMAPYTTAETQGCSFLQNIGMAGCCEYLEENVWEETPNPTVAADATTLLRPPSAAPHANATLAPVMEPIVVNSGATSNTMSATSFLAIGISLVFLLLL